MRNLGYLLAANIVVWVVIFGYIYNLMRKNIGLKRDIRIIKENLASGRSKE